MGPIIIVATTLFMMTLTQVWVQQKSLLLGLIALFLYSGFSGITEASETRRISLDQVVQLAVKHNQDLKTAKNDARYSTLSLEKEKNDYLPQVTGTLNSRMTRNYSKSGSERNTYNSDAGLAVSLNLFNGFEDEASFEIARHELSSFSYTVLRQEQQVIFDTVSAYLNVVRQLREIEIAKENFAYNRQKEKQIKAFYDAGKIPLTDVYQQQAETAGAKSDLITAENILKKGELELTTLMGTENVDGIALTMPEINLQAMADEIDSKSMTLKAFQARADLLALEKNISAKQAGIREAESGRYPSLDLTAGITGSYSNQYDEDEESRIWQDDLDSYVGVTISVPLFDKHLTRIRMGQARIDKQTAILSLEKLKDQIRVELGEAMADFKSACETIKVTKTRLLYAQKALESANQRYRVGKSGLTELIQIRSDLVEARNNAVEAQIDQLLKAVSIFFYRGDLGLSQLLSPVVSHPAGKEVS